MPSVGAHYVRCVSATLDGSLTPWQILNELPVADGWQYMAQYYRDQGHSLRPLQNFVKGGTVDVSRLLG